MEKSNVEMLRSILEIGLVITVVFLVVKFILKLYKDKFIAQKNKQTKKSDFLNFLNEINQEDLSTSLNSLEKIPLDELRLFEDELVKFYLENFYTNPNGVKKLGKYLSFIEGSIESNNKEFILKILQRATLEATPETLAKIVVYDMEMKAREEAISTPGFKKLAKDFILETVGIKTNNVKLFLDAVEIAISDLLSTNTLSRRGKAIIAAQYLTLTSKYKKPKRRAE